MFTIYISLLSDFLLIFCLAFLIDLVFGEIPDRIHPTLWMGKITDYFKPKLKNENLSVEKINGVLLCLFLITLFAVPVYFLLFVKQTHLKTFTNACIDPQLL